MDSHSSVRRQCVGVWELVLYFGSRSGGQTWVCVAVCDCVGVGPKFGTRSDGQTLVCEGNVLMCTSRCQIWDTDVMARLGCVSGQTDLSLTVCQQVRFSYPRERGLIVFVARSL